jgi:hypothetical protein
MRAFRSIVVFSALGAFVGGCDSNAEKFKKGITPIVEKHREPLKKQLDGLHAAQKAAAAAPPIKPIEGASGGDFFLIDEDMKLDQPGSAHPSRPPGCHPFYFGGNVFAVAGGWIPESTTDLVEPKPEHFSAREEEYKKFEAVRYALVCKQLEAKQPKEEAGGTFSGATYKGQCRAFEIDGAKYVGGFELNVSIGSASVRGPSSVANAASSSLGKEVTAQISREAEKLGKPVAASMSCGWPSDRSANPP